MKTLLAIIILLILVTPTSNFADPPSFNPDQSLVGKAQGILATCLAEWRKEGFALTHVLSTVSGATIVSFIAHKDGRTSSFAGSVSFIRTAGTHKEERKGSECTPPSISL
ncbi:MAG: hypothetical protein IH946_09595 [Bacteroidetes bacterium]|nr:hypothetical protein [Bacteroidota bacterium]